MATRKLTERQVRLLSDIVEASRRSPERFMMLRTVDAVWLQHPGFPDGPREIDFEDASALKDGGFLNVDEPGNYGGFHFVVAPAGVKAIDDLRRETGDPTGS